MPRVRDMPHDADAEYDECEELLANIQNGHKSSCGALILKVNEYLKKPSFEHDLSSILNTYLQILHSSDVYIDNGIFNTNFAEAALLLQGTVTLHGKQVDLLWDFVIEYLNRNMSYEEKTEENKEVFEKLEERKTKYKRKRKVNEEAAADGENSNTTMVSFVVDKKSACVQGMYFEDFLKFGAIEEKSKEDSTTYERDNFSGEYKDNWKQRWNEHRNPILEGKVRCGVTIPKLGLLRHLDSNILYDKIIPIAYDLTEINMYGEKEPMGDYGASSSFDRINREFNALHSQVHTHDIPETQIEHGDVQDFTLQKWLVDKGMTIENVYQHWDEFQADCASYEASMYKLKTKVSEEQPRRSVCYFEPPMNGPVYDVVVTTPLPAISPIVDVAASQLSEQMDISNIMDKRNDPTRKTMDSDMDSGVFDACSSMTSSTPHQATSIRALSVHSDGIFDATTTPKQVARPETPCINSETVLETVEGVNKCFKRPRRAKLFDDFDIDDDGNLIEKPPKKARRIRERLRPTTTASLKAFNRFFCTHYQPETGEGVLETIEEEDDDDNNDYDEELGDLLEFPEDPLQPMATSTPHESFRASSAASTLLENITETNDTVVDQSFADIMEQDAGTRLKHVLEWKKFITEKIGLQKKSDFDIHEEETMVIDSIGIVGKTVRYKDMCEQKSAAAVSRNFIAMLHLANTNNIEIMDIQQGQLSNECLKVKLLSTERHHEQLNEYNAPSETTYKDKLHAVHVALKRNNGNGTVHGATKKRKFH